MMTEELRHLPGSTRAPTYLALSLDKQSPTAPAVLRRALVNAEAAVGISGAAEAPADGRASADAYELASERDEAEAGEDETAGLVVQPAVAGSDLEAARAGSPYADQPAPGQAVFVASTPSTPVTAPVASLPPSRPRTPAPKQAGRAPDRPGE